MQAYEIKRLFNAAYCAKTNLTKVMRYGKSGEYLYALSILEGINAKEYIYCVNVLNLDGSKTHHLNSCFLNSSSAEQYINSLRTLADDEEEF